jgi:hypothetical protein
MMVIFQFHMSCFEQVTNDLTSSLVPSLPTMCSGKTCKDSVMSLKLVTTNRKKVATIMEYKKESPRETEHLIMHM